MCKGKNWIGRDELLGGRISLQCCCFDLHDAPRHWSTLSRPIYPLVCRDWSMPIHKYTVLYPHPSNETPEKLRFQQKVVADALSKFQGWSQSAVFTFTKAVYRLDETVQDAVELDEQTSRARAVELPAYLETCEPLPTALTSAPSSGSPATCQPKRIYAKHYSSFMLSTLHTTFLLDIPSDTSTAFQIKFRNEKATGHGLQGSLWSQSSKLRVEPILLMKHPTPPPARLFPLPGSLHPPRQIDIALLTFTVAQYPDGSYESCFNA
ncbi:hypothetical protein K435DRAFT_891478 [Dendrothele bispora CBS 962.96]|uniref:Uncharacterized protein n=1 Tax=Dendrothele bispora (strain CBS 962.96) TaxID=1314807 RepID=A0A4S8M4S0_DENBC|nr:hypothetical protein K435DRAFT_891478 [Dendrothele bispora CBS 962.96]